MIDEYDDDDHKTSIQMLDPRLRQELQEGTSGRTAVIIILGGSATLGRMFKVDGRMIIGRGETAGIRIDESGVSRQHAEISVRPDGSVEISDLGSTNGTWIDEKRITSAMLKDGDRVQIGTAAILKFSYQDALEEEMQRSLYDAATRDGLTRLYNKKFFSDSISKEFAFARRHGNALSLMVADADHFKNINDTWGHPAGDYVLQRLAQCIVEQLGREEIACRYGGEEFAVILRDLTEAQAAACAERIRAAVEATSFVYKGQRLPVTISIGLANLAANMKSEQELFTLADQRLYEAKHSGRNRVVPAPAEP